MVYMILYKINPSDKNYASLFEKIKSLGMWMRYFDDAWFLQPSSLNKARDIYDQLIPYINGDKDYLFVLQIVPGTDSYGWLPTDAWDWLKARLQGVQ